MKTLIIKIGEPVRYDLGDKLNKFFEENKFRCTKHDFFINNGYFDCYFRNNLLVMIDKNNKSYNLIIQDSECNIHQPIVRNDDEVITAIKFHMKGAK